jgi:hypothetical protein
MHTATNKPDLIVPPFSAYVENRKYLKNASPKTLTRFVDAWKAFGPHIEPALASGGRLTDALKAAVLVLLEIGVRPVSVIRSGSVR